MQAQVIYSATKETLRPIERELSYLSDPIENGIPKKLLAAQRREGVASASDGNEAEPRAAQKRAQTGAGCLLKVQKARVPIVVEQEERNTVWEQLKN